MLELYGVEHPSKSNIVKEKRKQTNLEHYGCENVFQSDIIKEKIKNKNLLNLGVEYPGQAKTCREKGWKTYKNKTGYKLHVCFAKDAIMPRAYCYYILCNMMI